MAEERFGFLLNDAARLLRRRFEQRARALGVTRAQWQVLIALLRNEGSSQAALADYLEQEHITLCRIVDRLQEAGLVERRADPNDRRVWRLFLTDAARPVIEQLRAVGAAVQDEALAGLPAPAVEQLSAALIQLRNNLSSKSAGAVEA